MNPSPLAMLASSAVLSLLLAAPHERAMVLASVDSALARVEPSLAATVRASVQTRVEQARAYVEAGELPKVAAARANVWPMGEPAF